MASSALGVALTEDSVRQAVEAASQARALPAKFLALAEDTPEGVNMVCGYLVYVRTGGFMVALPLDDLVNQTLDALSLELGISAPIFHTGQVAVETVRGRRVGEALIQLADLSWEFAVHFVSMGRISAAQRAKILSFSLEASEVRPVKASVQDLANAWIDSMDPDTAQEYVTGEEFADAADPTPSVAPDLPAGVSPEVHQKLQDRVAELEAALLQQRQVPVAPAGVPPGQASKVPPLFNKDAAGGVMSAQEWGRLQLLAGTPPPRVGTAEKRRQQSQQALPVAQDHALLDQEREATEADQMVLDPAMVLGQTSDPLHQLLALQMQQNQALLQKLVGPKVADPVLGVLSSGGADSASGSSSTGVKGCLAREAFLQSVTKLPAVANATRMNALRELGMDHQKEDGSLIRKYMERRMALSEHRLLTYFTAMIAEGWQIGYESGNMEMLGVLSRMLYFVEQTAIDGGRPQMGWLLTGWQEPPFHLLTSSKRMPGLQPYARLCHPSWVSANIAYLKDMDYLEGRLSTLGSQKPSRSKTDDADPAPKIHPKNKPKKPKGQGKGASSDGPKTDPAATV